MSNQTIRINRAPIDRILGNKVNTICIWDYQVSFEGVGKDGQIKEMNPFVDRVQFMTATGGNPERDLFADPMNCEIRDDYDFEKLINACANALRLGVKPFIKTGSIPMKFTAEPLIGKFGVNMHAPDDMEEYYRYIRAIAEALVASFGLAEVQSWGFGVFTEFENHEWFCSSLDPKEGAKNFGEIYDYTVAALTDVLGEDILVGAHAMMTADLPKLNAFLPQDFFAHCAKEKNARNGKKVKIDYLAFSYYDGRPFKPCPMTIAQVKENLRNLAEEVGLTGIYFACDEGRINSGGVDQRELSPRAVGYRYQAAMDADLLWQMVNADIEYFAAWSYRSGGLMDGLKSVGTHVAECYYRMVGMKQVGVDEEKAAEVDPFSERTHALAAEDANGNLHAMIYDYHPGQFRFDEDCNLTVSFPTKAKDGSYPVTARYVDDSCNFFARWEKERDAQGLKTDSRWSEESQEVFTQGFDPARYEEDSHLIPRKEFVSVANGIATYSAKIAGNSALFLDFEI